MDAIVRTEWWARIQAVAVVAAMLLIGAIVVGVF